MTASYLAASILIERRWMAAQSASRGRVLQRAAQIA
jgi:hypothetical protein